MVAMALLDDLKKITVQFEDGWTARETFSKDWPKARDERLREECDAFVAFINGLGKSWRADYSHDDTARVLTLAILPDAKPYLSLRFEPDFARLIVRVIMSPSNFQPSEYSLDGLDSGAIDDKIKTFYSRFVNSILENFPRWPH